jgi:hypothetical protein
MAGQGGVVIKGDGKVIITWMRLRRETTSIAGNFKGEKSKQ